MYPERKERGWGCTSGRVHPKDTTSTGPSVHSTGPVSVRPPTRGKERTGRRLPPKRPRVVSLEPVQPIEGILSQRSREFTVVGVKYQ